METTLRNQIIELSREGYCVSKIVEMVNTPYYEVVRTLNQDDDGKWLKPQKLAWITRHSLNNTVPPRSLWESHNKQFEFIPFTGLFKIQKKYFPQFRIRPTTNILYEETIHGKNFVVLKLNEGITVKKCEIKYLYLHPNGKEIFYADMKKAA